MSRVRRQGSGSGASAAVPSALSSEQVPNDTTTGVQASAPEVLDTFPTPVGDDEDALGEEDFAPIDTQQANGDPSQRMPDYARPGPKAADASPAPHNTEAGRLAEQRRARAHGNPVQSLAGKYVALARLNREDENGQIVTVAPHTELFLEHAEAVHFLTQKTVRSLGVRTERKTVHSLPPDQNFGGRYVAKARLSHEDPGRVVMPGDKVVLTDAEARHYLASGVVESATGLY